MKYSWPGNIRELQNVVEQMMNFVRTDTLTVDLIPPEITQRTLRMETVPASLEAFEQTMLKNMLDSNLTKAEVARKMQISRSTLYRKRKKHDLLS